MTTTRPSGDQLRFQSAATGEHVLDAYLEATEKGGRTLSDILDDLWRADTGALRSDLWSLRINPSTFVLEQRTGDYIDPNAGWVSVANSSFFRQRGTHAAATAYLRLDLVLYNDTVYICNTPHTSSGAIPDGTKFNPLVNLAATGVTSFNGRTGTVTLISGDITGVLGYTPISPASLSSTVANYLPLAGGTLTGGLSGTTLNLSGAATLPSADVSATGTDAVITIRQGTAGAQLRSPGLNTAGLRFVHSNGTTEWGRFDASGNFGLNTTNPQSRFHLKGGLRLEDATDTTTRDWTMSVTTAGLLQISETVGNNNVFINGSGQLGLGTTPTTDLTIGNTNSVDRTAQLGSTNSMRLRFATSGASNLATITATDDISAGALAFATGFPITERMRIQANGNVGINTTTPESNLDVGGSAIIRTDANGFALFAPKNGTSVFGANYDRFEIRVDTATQVTNIGNTNSGTGQARALAFLAGNAERVRINTSGDVGIGTPTPAFKLDVVGTLRSIGIAQFDNDVLLNKATLNTLYFDTAFALARNGTGERLRITSSGLVGIGTTNPGSSLEVNGGIRARGGTPGANGVNNNGYAFGSPGDTDSGMFSSADGQLEFYSNNGEVMRLSSGNVGIGTTSPGARLDVAGGNVRIANNQNLQFRNFAGTGTTTFTHQSDDNFVTYNAAGTPILSFSAGATPYVSYGANANLRINMDAAAQSMAFVSSGVERATLFSDGTFRFASQLQASGSITSGYGVSTGDVALELGGLRTGSGATYIDLHATNATDFEARILRNAGVNGHFQIYNTGTGNLEISQIGNAPLIFKTQDVERARIDGNGNLGIGSTNPVNNAGWGGLTINGTSGSIGSFSANGVETFRIQVNGGQTYLNNIAATPLIFQTNNAERMRLDAAGNLGIGTSPSSTLDVNGNVEIVGTLFLGSSNHGNLASDTNTLYLRGTNLAFQDAGGSTNKLVLDTNGDVTSPARAAAVGYKGVPQNPQSGTYTTILADMGKHLYNSGGAATWTIAANASVAYPIGATLTFVNDGSGNMTIAINSDTLIWSPFGTTGSRTLAPNGIATAVKITATRWFISGSGLS